MAAPAVRRPCRGFTVIEVLCALAVGAVLATIALPSYTHVVHKVRRSDATLSLLQLQVAEERHRADHPRYGSLADLRLSDRSSAGHYRLVVARADEDGFEIHALASGAQEADGLCRRLTLRVDAGHAVYASGSDPRQDNPDAANRRCWSA